MNCSLLRFIAAALSLLGLSSQPARAQVAGKIAVYPQTSSVESTSTKQFSAYVPISPNTIVWLVNEIPGGNATVGSITSNGLYKPPAVIPTANVMKITARSAAYPGSLGNATLTVTRPYPWLWSVSPSSFPVGPHATTFNGSNFASDSQALANGVPVATQFVSPTKLVASGTAAQVGTIQFSVRQPGPGAVTGNRVNAKVLAAVVKVTPRTSRAWRMSLPASKVGPSATSRRRCAPSCWIPRRGRTRRRPRRDA